MKTHFDQIEVKFNKFKLLNLKIKYFQLQTKPYKKFKFIYQYLLFQFYMRQPGKYGDIGDISVFSRSTSIYNVCPMITI